MLGRTYLELFQRTGMDPAEVEDVISGCVQQIGEQSYNVARNAWLQAGLPIETAAMSVDRQCGSAQAAVSLAALQIAAGIHDVVIGSGVEHMGHIPFSAGDRVIDMLGSPWTPAFFDKHNVQGQGIGAE